jgi:hypothetical protein
VVHSVTGREISGQPKGNGIHVKRPFDAKQPRTTPSTGSAVKGETQTAPDLWSA